MVVIDILPMPAPRMVRSDKWAKRPVVTKYFAWRDEFVMKCNVKRWELSPHLDVTFNVEMPSGWSEKKKKLFDGSPHQQRPDLDNMVKSVCDAFGKDDGFVYSLRATKLWARIGSIILQ